MSLSPPSTLNIIIMTLPSSAEVLIVGAGPTGMVLALALQKNGCPDVVIVDGALEGENTSRAIAIHAATIEVRFFYWDHLLESVARIREESRGVTVWT